MYVGRVSLTNWKNFKSAGARLPERVFVIGPNASGKSNFLDAFRFLSDVAFRGLRDAVAARGGVSALRCLAARESSNISLDMELFDGGGKRAWRYLIEFSQDSSRMPILKREEVEGALPGDWILRRPGDADQDDRELLTQTALEQIVANRDFRPVADFFRSIRYQHIVPQVVRDPDGFTRNPVENDPYGRDLLRRIWNTLPRTRTAWLGRIASVLRQAVPQLQSLDVEMDGRLGVPHLVGRYEHWRAHAAKQTEAQFSDGTLRLIGLMWAMFDGEGPLLLEEPELSLHPEVVRALPSMFASLQQEIVRMKRGRGSGTRQVLVSTHSGEILEDLGIGPGEVLIIEPSAEGSKLGTASSQDLELLAEGMSPREVFVPRSAPRNGQLVFQFR